MVEEYDGADVMDEDGDKLGRIDATYEDNSGQPRYVEVKLGSLLGKRHLIPVDHLQHTENGFAVPYAKQVVEHSPQTSTDGDALDEDTHRRVRAYYSGVESRLHGTRQETDVQSPDDAEDQEAEHVEAASVPIQQRDMSSPGVETSRSRDEAQGPSVDEPAVSGLQSGSGQRMGEVRDLGDVIEIPIVEEELVKRPVVREVLRIRKSQQVETRAVDANVRKEDVLVDTGTDEIPEGER